MSPLPPIPASHLNGPAEPERRLRLMEVVRRRLRKRRYSARTEEAYVFWICRFIVENGRRHPSDLGEPDVARFLSTLALKELDMLHEQLASTNGPFSGSISLHLANCAPSSADV